MATKTSKAAATKDPTPKPKGKMVATFPEAPDPEKADAMAEMALRPSVNAAAVMVEYTKPLGEQDLGALEESLSTGINDLWAGDMKRAEAMLYGQAHALQAIFMNLARQATTQEYMKNWEANLRMALKAQNQCRMTLETLATIKNPPVVFARQANINNGGQQQVNNGSPSPNPIGSVQEVDASAAGGRMLPVVDSPARLAVPATAEDRRSCSQATESVDR